MNKSRRDFIKAGGVAGVGLLAAKNVLSGMPGESSQVFADNELLSLSYSLLQQWVSRLVYLQINNPEIPGLHGGILCPACSRIHGRVGDAIYPLMFLADKDQEQKYLNAALHLYDWQEKMVSQADGSWLNDVNVSTWKWTTVFGATALAETLTHHGHLLDSKTRDAWSERLEKAAGYIYKAINWENNINYPVTCSYAFALIGTYLSDDKYIKKGKEYAHNSLNYFTENDCLLFGEGPSMLQKSPKGCHPIDLGYNVEESLPALAMYAQLTNDEEVLGTVVKSLKSHMEFMLPDGAWDNSWGTRNFKWTYWGSRTSDGCQPAYALLSGKVPEFYKVALQNTKLLARCTENGYLYGGMHYASHGVLPCVHHAFAHSKALANVLYQPENVNQKEATTTIVLPREKEYDIKFFPDIQTWLVSKGDWRGTVTGYDREYHFKNGHATGGALAILWHNKVGPLFTASMNKYQVIENTNMQVSNNVHDTLLTPRFEFVDKKGNRFMNISDLAANITIGKEMDEAIFHVSSNLVDKDQKHPDGGPIKCELSYVFKSSEVLIKGICYIPGQSKNIKFFLPLVSSSDEKTSIDPDNKITIHKPGGKVNIVANVPIHILPTKKNRVFNFVPGMEAIPIEFESNDVEIKIYVNKY